jgi:hypothetical protein
MALRASGAAKKQQQAGKRTNDLDRREARRIDRSHGVGRQFVVPRIERPWAESIIRILVFVRGCKMVETRFSTQTNTEQRPRPSFRHAAGMKFLAESRPCRSIASPSENR